MTPISALLADDEPLARERIRTLLAGDARVKLLAECANGREAVAQIRALRPQIALLDIQMPELDGFEVLSALEPDLRPLVLFVTAFDAYAVRAFEVHAIDYLLKPLTKARFSQAIERAIERLESAPPAPDPRVAALLAELEARRRGDDRLAVKSDGAIRFVRVEDIDWIEAASNYVKLHALGEVHIARASLKDLADKLDPDRFVRVHRSAIVNISRIERLEPWFHGEYVIVLRDGNRLTSSRTFSDRLRAILR